jgi:ubiquinone biosynthesis protein UbiJ
VSVSFLDDKPNGLARLLGDLIAQNLSRDPSRHRHLQPSVVAIEATDADTAVTLRFSNGAVQIANGADPDAQVHVRAHGAALLALAGSPLRFGLPNAMDPRGRAVVAEILRGEIRVRGLVSRLPVVRRLTMLLSAN